MTKAVLARELNLLETSDAEVKLSRSSSERIYREKFLILSFYSNEIKIHLCKDFVG